MFFKRAAVPSKQLFVPTVAWDEKTCAHFAKIGCFDVSITSITKCFGFGATEHSAIREPIDYEVRGIITYPKYVQVTLKISKEEGKEFGGWFYNVWLKSDERHRKSDMPFLDMWLFDPRHEVAEALYEAHKAALACGGRKSQARFWKRSGDGVMTPKDIAAGYSEESRYPLLGMYTWSLYQSRSLPRWALPFDDQAFSAENSPPRYDMQL
jgi:hypothetical protein